MAATVITVEFLHHPTIIPVWRKIWSLFVQFFWQIQKLTENYLNCDILVQNNHVFKQQHEYKLASSPLYACLTKIDHFSTFRRNFSILIFAFVNKQSLFTW